MGFRGGASECGARWECMGERCVLTALLACRLRVRQCDGEHGICVTCVHA